jgi:hypothetical protein
MQRTILAIIFSICAIQQVADGATLAIDDFNSWTFSQDPPHDGMTGSVENASQTTLSASGAIPAGTDVAFQSVDENLVADSTSGNYFSSANDFHIAVDFDVTTANSQGLAAIGFGIGEDAAGANSAGPGLAIFNGGPLAFSGGARINDVTQAPALFGPAATTSGRLFVRYDIATGDIIFGVNTTPGAAAPSDTGVFLGLQNSWNDKDLLVSFFLRSDAVVFPALSAGTVDAVFSNFEVLDGTAIAAVPEPGTFALLLSAAVLLMGRSRQ